MVSATTEQSGGAFFGAFKTCNQLYEVNNKKYRGFNTRIDALNDRENDEYKHVIQNLNLMHTLIKEFIASQKGGFGFKNLFKKDSPKESDKQNSSQDISLDMPSSDQKENMDCHKNFLNFVKQNATTYANIIEYDSVKGKIRYLSYVFKKPMFSRNPPELLALFKKYFILKGNFWIVYIENLADSINAVDNAIKPGNKTVINNTTNNIINNFGDKTSDDDEVPTPPEDQTPDETNSNTNPDQQPLPPPTIPNATPNATPDATPQTNPIITSHNTCQSIKENDIKNSDHYLELTRLINELKAVTDRIYIINITWYNNAKIYYDNLLEYLNKLCIYFENTPLKTLDDQVSEITLNLETKNIIVNNNPPNTINNLINIINNSIINLIENIKIFLDRIKEVATTYDNPIPKPPIKDKTIKERLEEIDDLIPKIPKKNSFYKRGSYC